MYLNDSKKRNTNSILIAVSNNFIEKFNLLTEYNVEYMEQKWTYKKLFIVMFCFKYFEDVDKTNMCQTIDKVFEKAAELDNELFYKTKSKKSIVNELEKIIEEVL